MIFVILIGNGTRASGLGFSRGLLPRSSLCLAIGFRGQINTMRCSYHDLDRKLSICPDSKTHFQVHSYVFSNRRQSSTSLNPTP